MSRACFIVLCKVRHTVHSRSSFLFSKNLRPYLMPIIDALYCKEQFLIHSVFDVKFPSPFINQCLPPLRALFLVPCQKMMLLSF